MKRALSFFLAGLLLLPAVGPAFAAAEPTQKEENVYGLLNPDGSVKQLYTVNSFSGGTITDYGDYSAVSNMTSLERLDYSGDAVTVSTAADRFYYQGTLKEKALPWDISVKYKLDGAETAPSELAGRSGALSIMISVRQNKAVNPVFYENYMLQVSLTLDTEKCADIASPRGTLANAGKNKVIAHTVLPGSGADISVTARVRDFSMGGIEFNAMPLSMAIDLPDTENLTEGMDVLTSAVASLNDGAGDLSEGISDAYSGTRKLAGGSSDFGQGLAKLNGNSAQLLGASEEIRTALAHIGGALGQSGGFDLSALAELPAGLRQLASGLTETGDGARTLKTGYASAYAALDGAISGIPDGEIDPSALYAAASGNSGLTAALDGLMKYYASAKTVKAVYSQTQEAFAAVEGGLDAMSGSAGTVAAALTEMADGIEQSQGSGSAAEEMRLLTEGLSQLAGNYEQFHVGLTRYADGVKGLADGYSGVEAGLQSLAGGMEKLNAGGKELRKGTDQLNTAVAELPTVVQEKLEELTQQYEGSDFVPVSFVSAKNTNVTAVQFALKTESIEPPEAPPSTAEVAAPLTFWQKLLKLFGLYQ